MPRKEVCQDFEKNYSCLAGEVETVRLGEACEFSRGCTEQSIKFAGAISSPTGDCTAGLALNLAWC